MSDLNEQLKTCPFCNAPARIDSNRDWHRLNADHDHDCILANDDPVAVFPAQEGYRVRMIEEWNRRAPAAAPIVQPVGDARLVLMLSAASGYEARHEYGCITPEQWGDVLRVCEGTLDSAHTTAAADAKDAALRIIDAHLAEYNESALGYEEAAAFNELESVRADIAAIATSADEAKS